MSFEMNEKMAWFLSFSYRDDIVAWLPLNRVHSKTAGFKLNGFTSNDYKTAYDYELAFL